MRNLRKIIIAAVVALGSALAVPGVAASEDQLVKLGKYEAASFEVSDGGYLRNTDADPHHTSNGSFLELYGLGITPQTATITVDTTADVTGAAVRVAGDRCVDPAEPLLNPW